jgi:hypothetical protein
MELLRRQSKVSRLCAINGDFTRKYLGHNTAEIPQHIITALLKKKKLNAVAWVRERTILTERPPLVGEVSANFCR